MDIRAIQDSCVEDSKRWFPDIQPTPHYLTIALAGEVGEFANIVKKVMRGSLEMNNKTRVELAMELTDCLIYACLLASSLQVDLGECYQLKREYNEERFGGGEHESSPDQPTLFDAVQQAQHDPIGAASFVPQSDLL